jgi:hypothetical protein
LFRNLFTNMTLTKIFNVENNQVIINLPDNFKGKTQLSITMEDLDELKLKKLNAMQLAKNDPLFLEDILDIQNDFKAVDF